MSKKCKFDLPKEQDAEDVLLSYKQGIKTGRAEALAEVEKIIDDEIKRCKGILKQDMDCINFDVCSGFKTALEDLKAKLKQLEGKSLVESKE